MIEWMRLRKADLDEAYESEELVRLLASLKRGCSLLGEELDLLQYLGASLDSIQELDRNAVHIARDVILEHARECSAESLLVQGDRMWKQGDRRSALMGWAELLRTNPMNTDAVLRLKAVESGRDPFEEEDPSC